MKVVQSEHAHVRVEAWRKEGSGGQGERLRLMESPLLPAASLLVTRQQRGSIDYGDYMQQHRNTSSGSEVLRENPKLSVWNPRHGIPHMHKQHFKCPPPQSPHAHKSLLQHSAPTPTPIHTHIHAHKSVLHHTSQPNQYCTTVTVQYCNHSNLKTEAPKEAADC